MKLYYQFPGTWFGDCMPFGKGDEFFLFHQRDNRNPEPFGEPFGLAGYCSVTLPRLSTKRSPTSPLACGALW